MTRHRLKLERLEARDTPATFVWSGAGGNDSWLNDANWAGNAHPSGLAASLDDLVFPTGATRFTTNNDLTNAAFNSITIQAGGYSLTGNGLSLGSNAVSGSGFVTVNGGVANATIGLNLQLAGPAGSDQFFAVGAASTLTINGALAGTGGSRLTKTGTGTLVLTADNSQFGGVITLGSNAGVLRMQGNPNALGTGANDTFIGNGSQLQIDSLTADTFEAIHLNGTGISNDGALLGVAGTSTTNGTVFLESNSTIGVSSGTLVLNGFLVAAGNSTLAKTGAGTLRLNLNETLTGSTTVTAGTLIVNGSIANSTLMLAGGTVGGTGNFGGITASGGTIQPALVAAPVDFRTRSVSLNGAAFSPTLVNNSSGDVSDLLNVTGTVDLTGATLTPITTGFTPSRQFSLLLVSNDLSDPIVGTFAGLAEGATVNVAGVPFTITYTGSDGNDVLLVPQTPIPTTDPFAASGLPTGIAVVYPPSPSGVYPSLPSTSFSPFGSIAATVRVATADVNGDSINDTILVTGPGVPIRVAVVSGVDSSTILQPFDPFGGDFTGGGFVAAADIDKDGRAEFAVTPDQGGGSRVTIFSMLVNGSTQTRANFFGIDDPAFRGGARAALGDVNHDGTSDLAVSAGFLGGPRTALFDGTTLFATPTRLVNDFFAFPGTDSTTLRNGVFVASGDVNGDGFADLIFGGGPGGAPRVFILGGDLVSAGNVAAAQAAPLANFFVAGSVSDRGGIRVAATDTDGDSKADVVTGSGEGSPGKIRTYLGKNFTGSGEPGVFQDLSAFGGGTLAGGAFVG